MSIKTTQSIASLKSAVFLLIFCLEDLSLDVSRVLKSPTILYYCQSLPLCPSRFALYIQMLLHWVYKHLNGLYPLVESIPLSLRNVLLCFLLQPSIQILFFLYLILAKMPRSNQSLFFFSDICIATLAFLFFFPLA